GRRSVIGIYIEMGNGDKLNINERAFEGMTNLQFVRIEARLSHGLSYLSPKIRLLDWNYYPMTCLPSPVNVEFLVKLNMLHSKLEKLWEGIKSLRNLKRMSLSFSKNLKELPNLSTAISLKELHLDGCKNLLKLPPSIGSATNLQKLDLRGCSSLVELPSSIGKVTNLQEMNLRGCSSLVELPSSIGKVTNLREMNLTGCSSLVELPSSFEKAANLQRLYLKNCSNLMKLPSCIGNSTNLQYLDLRGCSSLVELPFYIGNAINLTGLNFSGCSSLVKVPASIENLKSLDSLVLSSCPSLKVFPEMSTNIRSLVLSGAAIEEVPSSIMRQYRLRQLILKGCKKLVSLPQLPESLSDLNVENCESLERLDCSFSKLYMKLNFANCLKLKKDARDLIIQSSGCYTHVLPGKEIPICFTHQANGGSLILKFNQRHFPSFLKIKACILLGCKSDTVIESWPYILVENEENDVEMLFEYSDDEDWGDEEKYRDKHVDKVSIYLGIRDKHNHVVMHTRKISDIYSPLTEHLYICKHFFYFEEDVTSHELFFEFSVWGDGKWVIKRCGVNNEAKEEIHEGNSSDCEANEEINEADVTSSGLFFELLTNDCGMDYGDCEAEDADVTTPVIFFEFLTNEAGEETNEGYCAERKKRKMDQDGDSSLVIDTSSKYTVEILMF
ncbi:hypothetical protein HID58_070614, partial [Brassica napus]